MEYVEYPITQKYLHDYIEFFFSAQSYKPALNQQPSTSYSPPQPSYSQPSPPVYSPPPKSPYDAPAPSFEAPVPSNS